MQLRSEVTEFLSDSTNIQKRFQSLERAETFDGYSKVIVNVTDDVRYISGTDVGRTLEITSPFGSQKVADDILSRIQGFQYQPFSASGAILDPAVELGDGISADGLYSGVFKKKISLGSLYTADVSAPGGEKINYQVPYKSKQERTIERNYRNLTTELKVQAGLISAEVTERKSDIETINAALKVQSGEISAKVSKTGGSASSFGWTLLDDSWTLTASNSAVLKATKDGVEIYGKLFAKEGGKIGGFDILANYLSYNNMTWGGTNTNGIYIGTSGIQLGKNFKVDTAGNLTAASGKFTGNVYAGNIEYGGSAGYLDGSGLSSHSVYGSQIGYNTISTSYTSSGINTSLGYADYANGVFNGWNKISFLKSSNITTAELSLNGSYIEKTTIYYKNQSGVNTSMKVLTWS